MRVPSERVGVLAFVGSSTLLGCTNPVSHSALQPANLRALVPQSDLAQTWQARRLAEKAQLDWETAQNLVHQSAPESMHDWEIAEMLETASCIPSENSVPLRVVISGVKEGQPHRVRMEEFDEDFDFLDSIRGSL